MATKYKQRKTPGVYVTELEAFPPSIVGVQTAVPGFIGYTEKAQVGGKSVYGKPIKVNTLAAYEEVFGKGFEPKYTITTEGAGPDNYDVKAPAEGGTYTYYLLSQTGDSQFYLYNSLRLFFANGGGTCYIVSVGDYTKNGTDANGTLVDLEPLQKGLKAMGEQVGPTMLVIPDAMLLPTEEDFKKLVSLKEKGSEGMLVQSGQLKDRVSLLDVYGTSTLDQDSADFESKHEETIEKFYQAVGDDYLSYGIAYYPFLHTSIVQPDEIDYTNFDDASSPPLAEILTAVAAVIYEGKPKQLAEVTALITAMSTTEGKEAIEKLDQNLSNALPILPEMERVVARKMSVLPPSGAMAGIYTYTDETRGVWNAPANLSPSSVTAPTLKLNNEQQGFINVPLNGKSIGAIRDFVGRGAVVWGARTLDGNSPDYRYVQVRRTLIYIEQSIKLALDPFVFAPNDGNTWTTAVSMVSNFLQGLWSQGGLMGATASEAFTVECGIGSTMTGQDILDGYMIVQVTLQMIRPAEFIELTIKQKMEGVA